AETAFLIPVRLDPVPPGHAIFDAPGARWASVDEEALAATLRTLFETPALAGPRAAAARALMARDYSIAAQARRYTKRLVELGCLPDTAVPTGLAH
ncbi:MAG: hypothetical protein AAFQ51_14755, partial [Pseudomonadota bacterium]